MIVLIPAYEPDQHLVELVRGIRTRRPAQQIVLVDDGSGPAYLEAPDLSAWPKVDWKPSKEAIRVDLDTLTPAVVASWKPGDRLLLNGKMLTGRDAAHKRMTDMLAAGTPHETTSWQPHPRCRVHHRRLQRDVGRQGWEQTWDALREHRLARARRPHQQHVVAAVGGHLQAQAGHGLPAHVGKVGRRRLVVEELVVGWQWP